MVISNIEEYKVSSDQTISIQFNEATHIWEVGCWNKDESCSWYKEYSSEEAARKEYERW